MIVLDASAALELFLHTGKAPRIAARIRPEQWCVPHLFDIEVLQSLRKLLRLHEIDDYTARLALESLEDASLFRFEHLALADRIWQLRDSLTAYDAAYVTLAELLHAPLLTTDAKLSASPGHRATIELL